MVSREIYVIIVIIIIDCVPSPITWIGEYIGLLLHGVEFSGL